MSDQSTPIFMRADTVAANPGRLKVQWPVFFRCFPTWPIVYAAALLLTLVLSVFISSAFWAVFVLIVVAAGLGLRQIREVAQHGCINPAQVVSISPPLIAVWTDLATSPEHPYPAIKIVRQPFDRMAGGPVTLGARVVTISYYQGRVTQRHWDDFQPTMVNCLNGDPGAAAHRLQSISWLDWINLEQGLQEVPQPYRPSLHVLQPPSIYPAGRAPGQTCTLLLSTGDPAAVPRVLDEIGAPYELEGPANAWSRLTVRCPSSRLLFTPLWPMGPGDRFSQVVEGLREYFAFLPGQDPVFLERALTLIGSCRLAVGVVADPVLGPPEGHRQVLFSLLARCGGVLYNGVDILDGAGGMLATRGMPSPS
jgi:hypothetical protein